MKSKRHYHTKYLVGLLLGSLALFGAPPLSGQVRRPFANPMDTAKKWVEKQWAALPLQDVPGRHRLMDIARDYGMEGNMRALAREILALDPKHAEAHRHLNHTLHQGKWLTPKQALAADLLKFDYEFPVGYKSPDTDRLLFPLYLTKAAHKLHCKRQYWGDRWVLKRKPLTLSCNATLEKVERFAGFFKTFAKDVTSFLGIPLKSNYEINIFRSREEYHTVGKAPRGTGGYYSPSHRKLFFYDDPRDQISTYRVLFHEGTHMIVHLTCKNKAFHYPICVNEGLAEYMGSARWDYRRRHYTFGHPLNDRIKTFKALLSRGRAKPLKDLVLHSRSGFGGAEYAQAWALITFLSDPRAGHSPKKLGLYLKRLYKDNNYKMLSDRDPRKLEAMAKIFEKTFFNKTDGTTWAAYQAKFWDYARQMQEEVGAPDFSRRYLRRLFGR